LTPKDTAIRRTGPSAPLRALLPLLPRGSRVLDLGCGHGADVAHLQSLGFSAQGWDPHWRPEPPTFPVDVVLCTYVLNVLPPPEQDTLIQALGHFLVPVYITVRRDIPRSGTESQWWVELDIPVVSRSKGRWTTYALR
jgi:ATP adenylyltransferase